MEALAARRYWDVLWVVLFGAVSSFWCVGAAERLGPTYDEPYFLRAGLQAWHAHTTKPLIDTGSAPMPMLVDTLPLLLWQHSTGCAIDPVADYQFVSVVARTTALAFWWLLLIYAHLTGRELAGPWAGRLAVALLALEPSLLAHAALATADIAVTAFLLALWFHFRRGRGQSWPWRVGLPAVFYGLGLFAKMSALTFGPIGMAAIELQSAYRAVPGAKGPLSLLAAAWRTLTGVPFRRDIMQIFWLGLLLLFVLCGSNWMPSPSFVKWADGLPPGSVGASMRWLAVHLAIFSNAGNVLGYQIRHNIAGHWTYLFGNTWRRAIWYYFPAVLTMKLTISLLALPLLLFVLARRRLWNWPCAVALALLLSSLSCRVQTGIRFMLPLITVAVIGFASALVLAATNGPGWRRRALIAVGVAAPLWAGWSARAVWPHGLCYINEMWGGVKDGYLLTCDSNYDWGQGVPELLAWAKRNGPVDVLYFGTDPAIAQPPLHRVIPRVAPCDQASHRYLAVGTTALFGPYPWAQYEETIARLRHAVPVARTTTFLIFDSAEAGLRPREADRSAAAKRPDHAG